MFNKKTDPLASSVKQVMQENALRRKLEQKLNEELGVASKKALPHELHDDYDAALKSSLQEADTRDAQVGISHAPPSKSQLSTFEKPAAASPKPALDQKGLTDLTTKVVKPGPDGGTDMVKEDIFKKALAKMKGKKEKVVDAPTDIAHVDDPNLAGHGATGKALQTKKKK